MKQAGWLKMAEYFKTITDIAVLEHKTLIWGFLIVSFCVYFFVLRGNLGRFLFVKKCQYSNANRRKTENEHISEIVELIFGGISKKSIKCFLNWIFCKSYTAEQKGTLFPLFVFLNYFHIISTGVCVGVWLISLLFVQMQWLSVLFMCIRIVLLDLPLFLLTVITIFKK